MLGVGTEGTMGSGYRQDYYWHNLQQEKHYIIQRHNYIKTKFNETKNGILDTRISSIFTKL